MTDLEITRLCAEAMYGAGYEHNGSIFLHKGSTFTFTEPRREIDRFTVRYDPFTSDAQAMALVKKFHLMVNWNSENEVWCMPMDQEKYGHLSDSPNCADLNRAICECVAKLKQGE